MSHIVTCRVCKKQFDTESLSIKEWIKPRNRLYYHTKCYDDWKNGKDKITTANNDIEFWYDAIVDFLYFVKKIDLDFAKFQNQWKSFTAAGKNMTPKGIYFSVLYYYDIMKGNPEKSQGGIGIIPYIYNDAAKYWVEEENRRVGTIDSIIKQIEERANRPTQKIIKAQTKKVDKWDLNNLGGE